jgi:hypothetical protein
MDFVTRQRIVAQAWLGAKDEAGEFDDAWVSFFVDYFPIGGWIENDPSRRGPRRRPIL